MLSGNPRTWRYVAVLLVVLLVGVATGCSSSETVFTEVEETTTTINESDLIAQSCIEKADDLIALELTGSISNYERTELERLRQLCAEEGFPIDGPPAWMNVTTTLPSESVSSSDIDSGDDNDSGDIYEGC